MKTFDSKGAMGTIDNITRAVHVHPALSEVVVRAASQIYNNYALVQLKTISHNKGSLLN
jgi:hypothetical protein